MAASLTLEPVSVFPQERTPDGKVKYQGNVSLRIMAGGQEWVYLHQFADAKTIPAAIREAISALQADLREISDQAKKISHSI